MPIDIYDKNGIHQGIIRNRYLDKDNIYLVAITDLNSSDINCNEDKMKKYLAGILKVKNLFGKVDEDRLKEEIDNLRNSGQYAIFQQLPYYDFIKYLFLKNYSGKNIEEYLEINGFIEEMIKGYMFFDINKVEIIDNKFVINEDMDYIQSEAIDFDLIPKKTFPYFIDHKENEWNSNLKPIFAKVTGYPIIHTDIMGAGEGFLLGANLSDFGGRNHSHETRLRIKSGNCEEIFDFPIFINAKKDMNIQLYMGEKNIEQIFCDGVIYRF